jgi:hypothetical protein
MKPSSAYTIAIAALDCNGNLSAFSSTIAVTTAAGSTDTNTPSVPQSPGVANLWVNHPTMAGLSWSAPATGTVAYYEVADNSGNVLARCFPTANTAPSYSKTNVNITNI